MKDWKEWFKSKLCFHNSNIIDGTEEDRYQAFLARMIDEGYVEANPVRFVKPDKFEVDDYFTENLGVDRGEPESDKFYNHWDSLNWYSGKTRIKSWKGRAATWIKNNETYKRNNTGNTKNTSAAEKVRASIQRNGI